MMPELISGLLVLYYMVGFSLRSNDPLKNTKAKIGTAVPS